MRLSLFRTLLLTLAGCLMLSLTYAQERLGSAPLQNSAALSIPGDRGAVSPQGSISPDFSKLSPLQQQMRLSCLRGADWLYNMNGVKGRFLYGYLPALKTSLEGDNYLKQAGSAFALAKAARLTGQERLAVRATQALLSLLDETIVDPNDPQVRCTLLPSVVVNRLGAAGILVAAICELPNPQADLIEKSEQLCNFIRRQAHGDGSLRCDDAASMAQSDQTVSISEYPGLALYGLMRSQTIRPASWKIDLVTKAVTFYRPWWQQNKDRNFTTWHSAAYAEAFLVTKNKVFAECVFEMNDWLCALQYMPDAQHPLWGGGFRASSEGVAAETTPQVDSAFCAESLAQACRVTRECGDVSRHQRYTDAIERCLQFLTTLQFTEGNTQHYADWYRPRLVGAFYASQQDGNLRIDYAQHAVCAMGFYLEYASR